MKQCTGTKMCGMGVNREEGKAPFRWKRHGPTHATPCACGCVGGRRADIDGGGWAPPPSSSARKAAAKSVGFNVPNHAAVSIASNSRRRSMSTPIQRLDSRSATMECLIHFWGSRSAANSIMFAFRKRSTSAAWPIDLGSMLHRLQRHRFLRVLKCHSMTMRNRFNARRSIEP